MVNDMLIKKISKSFELLFSARKMQKERDQLLAEYNELKESSQSLLAKVGKPDPLFEQVGLPVKNSIDLSPWNHPCLTDAFIARFREYSDAVHQFSMEYSSCSERQLKLAFDQNMAQNMYKWARLVKKQGADVTLFLNPMDMTALNQPEWEEFDGSFMEVYNGNKFLSENPLIVPQVPYVRPLLDGSDFLRSCRLFYGDNRKPLLRLMATAPGLRHEVLQAYSGFYTYLEWAKELAQYDAVYSCGSAFAAYASGRPYSIFSFGGDLIFDCGRTDDSGLVAALSFNAARFLTISNPHAIAQARRIGLTNGVYLPYPIEDCLYCPGEGAARSDWEKVYGEGVYILTTSRLDEKYKGYDTAYLEALLNVAQANSTIRFVFLAWGDNADSIKIKFKKFGLKNQFIILPPVGKKRLIDYYRSCDIVLDQFVFGYYGATGLEAAAVGKPLIIKLRKEHYAPLYKGDVMPAVAVDSPQEIAEAINALACDQALRQKTGEDLREWLIRTHGEAATANKLLALLRLTADQVPLPLEIARLNPLLDEESEEEKTYHQSCLQELA